jgi:hypothetical protein
MISRVIMTQIVMLKLRMEDSIYNDLKVWRPGSGRKQGAEPGLDTSMNQIDFICFKRSNLCFFLVWFNQPKHMPDWLYQFFGDVVKPLLFAKDIHNQSQCAPPSLFTDSTQPHSPPTF